MTTEQTKYRIELFGGIRVVRHDCEITRFRTHKTGMLLAYLALHLHSRISREQLIDLFWPELESDAARNNLSTALSSLRSQLEPSGTKGRVLRADHVNVGLNEDAVITDVGEFERCLEGFQKEQVEAERIKLLERAVAMYRGDIVPGMYEDWALSAQSRLRELYLETLRSLANLYEIAGNTGRTLETANRLIELDPLDEESCRTKMRALSALARHGAALEAYSNLVSRLRDEVGMSPTPVSQQLAEQIRRQSEAEDRSPQPVHTIPPKSAQKTDSPIPMQSDPSAVPAAPLSLPKLPLQLTRFFGRTEEIQTLMGWLEPITSPEYAEHTPPSGPGTQTKRLVTVTGSGGAGKTRLALEIAARLVRAYRGRIYYVAMADIPDPRLMTYAVAHALHVQIEPRTDPIDQIAAWLGPEPVLLVLDNLEHLLREDEPSAKLDHPIDSPAAAWVRRLLECAEGAACLVTSRRILGLQGEQEFPLTSLALPQDETDPAVLSEYASIALYIDRARLVKPDFALTAVNAMAIAALCRRLEGMPLAIELAAAWARSITPQTMLDRLERQLDVLVSRNRDLPTRHRTMRAACEWSYALLPEALRETFASLSVFRSAWTLSAAEAVCGMNAMSHLAQLQEHSLVVVDRSGSEEARYRLLEPLRQYAAEKLAKDGDMDRVSDRHARYYAALMHRLKSEQTERRKLLQGAAREHENLRAAFAWFMKDDANAPEALQLAADMLMVWTWRSELSEGRIMLERALAHPANQKATPVRGDALNNLGNLALNQGDLDSARVCYEQSHAVRRACGNTDRIPGLMYNLALVCSAAGDHAESRRLTEDAIGLCRDEGDSLRIAKYRCHLGVLASQKGDFLTAREQMIYALSVQRKFESTTDVLTTLTNIGNLYYRQKDYEGARAYYSEKLSYCVELGLIEDTLYPICGFAAIAMDQGEHVRAARLYAAFETQLQALGIELAPEYQAEQEEAHLRLRTALGDVRYNACRSEGASWTLSSAVKYALENDRE